jgi:predicted HicB family RNase H-like nuclease
MPTKAADPLVQFKIRIPASVRRQLKVYAAQSGTPMQQLVADALTALLKRKGAV